MASTLVLLTSTLFSGISIASTAVEPAAAADACGKGESFATNYGSNNVSVISGSTKTVFVSPAANYSVVFTESGLPSGTTWWVNLTKGHTFNSTTTSLSFNETNGTYNYTVATTDKELASAGGSFKVNGTLVVETVTFSLFTYTVTFTVSGLPVGTNWSITIGSQTVGSDTHQIVFPLGNGTYSYRVNIVSGYKTTATNTNFNVSGKPVALSVKFSVMRYAITFSETGLPSRTKWTVNLTLSSGLTTTVNSTTATIKFSEPNGTYRYSIAPISGYQITTGSSTGSVTVAGANPTDITTHWTKVKSSSASGLSTLDYVVIGVVVFWVAIGAVIVLRRRKGKSPPGPPTPPSQAEEAAPPTTPTGTESDAPPAPPAQPGEGVPPAPP